MSGRAIVLRCRPVGDHDVLVDCLTETQGRLTARAKGANERRVIIGVRCPLLIRLQEDSCDQASIPVQELLGAVTMERASSENAV